MAIIYIQAVGQFRHVAKIFVTSTYNIQIFKAIIVCIEEYGIDIFTGGISFNRKLINVLKRSISSLDVQFSRLTLSAAKKNIIKPIIINVTGCYCRSCS